MSNQKYTYEEIKKHFSEAGCELLEEEYKNAHQLMKYKCQCGEEAVIRWHSFRRGSRCSVCSGTKKPKFEEVSRKFKELGCELLESEYSNAKQPMRYRCKCGNIGKKSYSAFVRHPCCSHCGQTCRNQQNEIADFYKKHGCELLDTYKNNHTQMKFKCKCGKTSIASFMNFKKSHQCIDCSGRHIYNLEEVKKIFSKNGCELLEIEYVDTKKKMSYRCKCGKMSEISLDKFKQGKRCLECGLRKGNKNGNWNPDRELVKLNQIVSNKSLTHLRNILKKQGRKKSDHIKNYVGYTVAELRDRLTNHPNWNNIKDKQWHIDHIFPIKAFLEHNITDIKIINALDNLRPLSPINNLKKSNKYNKQDFQYWLATLKTTS